MLFMFLCGEGAEKEKGEDQNLCGLLSVRFLTPSLEARELEKKGVPLK